jgi:hypothetical protein
MSPSRVFIPVASLLLGALLSQAAGPARSVDIASIVQSYCLVAVEQEVAQSGKVAPAGMAAYACRCMVDRLSQGTSLDLARDACRASTARRYAL